MIDIGAARNAILGLAMQGILTDSKEDDETIELTYASIKLEKETLSLERNARKDKNINDDYSNTPFSIPARWSWIKLADIGLFKKGPFGSSLTKSMFVSQSDSTVKVFEQQNAIKHDYTLGNYYITRDYFESSMSGFEVFAGDIIVSCAGTIGETYIMPDGIPCGIINQALMKITLVPSIDKQFFCYYFDYALKKEARKGNGMAIVNIPTFDILKNWLFPLIPLSEQKRIVAKINCAFEMLDKIDSLQTEYSDNIDALKESIIKLGLSGKLVDTDTKWDDESIYKPLWSVTVWDKKFRNISREKQENVIRYKYALAATLQSMEDTNGDVFLLSTGSYQGYTTEEKAGEYLHEGEIVAIPWGGSPVIKYYNGKFVTSDNRIATSVDTSIMLNRYLYYYFIGNKKYLKSVYRGTGLEHPEMAKILDMSIPIPPVDEQQEIIDKLDNLLYVFDAVTTV